MARLPFPLLLLLVGCPPAPPPLEPEPEPTPEPTPAPVLYDDAVANLDVARKDLGRRWMNATDADARAAVLVDARDTLRAAIRDELMPPWFGTPWAYSGTSEEPGRGSIACGYFVSTVLRDAGLSVERVRLAQQASAHIVRTFDRDAPWLTGQTPLQVTRAVKERGAGLYTIGLDYHVGFLSWDGEGPVELCHSSVLFPGSVLCEDAVRAEAMISRVHVLGDVLTDGVVEAWIEGKRIPTAG